MECNKIDCLMYERESKYCCVKHPMIAKACIETGNGDFEEQAAMCEANAQSVLDDVLAILQDDHDALAKSGMNHKATGMARAIYLINEYRKHVV